MPNLFSPFCKLVFVGKKKICFIAELEKISDLFLYKNKIVMRQNQKCLVSFKDGKYLMGKTWKYSVP